MWINEGESTFRGIIEPTNEEGGAQLMLSLAHGAQGLMWYIYQTKHYGPADTYIKRNFNLQSNANVSEYFILGLYGENDYAEKRRISNIYGQNKWEYYKKLNQKINNWIPTLDKIKWDNGFSVHQDGVENYYIKDIKSIFRDYTGVFSDGPSCPNCDNVKYWEEGFFSPTDNNDLSKYFLMINRRCVPEVAGRNAGDIRQLKIKFKASELAGFNNWKLINVEDGSTITTFNKNSQDYVDAGEFQPGEGKLFKLAPVMQEGGTFVGDEQIINKIFDCKAPVHTGGYKLELLSQNSGQTTVTFKPGAQIVGEIGNEIWIWGTNNNHVKLIGNNWLGIVANDLEYLNMEFVDMENISNTWAISAYNCYDTKVDYCVLNLVESKRAINVNNTNEPDATIAVYNNSINVSNSLYTVFFGGSAGSSNTLYFCDNTITSSTQSQVGILLSNINSSFVVSGNHISGFNNGLKLLNCGLDLTSNTIENSGDNSVGIDCYSLSTINMGLNGSYLAGHDNKIISHGSQCKNISLDNSTFQMDYGSNNLQVDIGSGSFNMEGYGNFVVNDDGPELFIEAKNNCFNLNGNMANHYITDPNGYRFGLHEIPHYCLKPRDLVVDFVQPLIGNLVDTVFKTTDSAYQNLSVTETLYQNFYLNLIKKNYDSTIIIGFNLLTNFADSTNATDIISKLYYSTSRIDSTGQNVTALKTFYEQLILNNTQNVMLVKSANYYIQKCKVQLEQYTSALDGFQDIMVQNPYSYEGVLASWDYAATLLLANSSGGYSSNFSEYTESNELNAENEYLIDTLRINKFTRNDKYDKKVFTTDDRKQLFKSVGNVLKDERSKQIEKVKTLEDKYAKADAKTDVKEKLKLQFQITDAKNINSVVKVKKPKDDDEYQVIVNNDIEKLNPKKETGNNGNNKLIPTTYNLYQNYPNPFNPTTKIAYDIPRDAKVKLVIYDILGREVKTIINNEFRSAGKYITEFNGSYLSSGIYFARILVNEGKDFIAVKKLVLLK